MTQRNTILVADLNKSKELDIDKGSYGLLIEVDKDLDIQVGALGTKHFPAGTYLYIGSAVNSINARVDRHLRKHKKRFWHIDYLLEHAKISTILCFPHQGKKECQVARMLFHILRCEMYPRGFGSSDCDCYSHLFRLKQMDKLNTEHLIAKIKEVARTWNNI